MQQDQSGESFCSIEEAFGILHKLQLHLPVRSDFDTFNSNSTQDLTFYNRDEAIDYTIGTEVKLKADWLFVSLKSFRLSSRPVKQTLSFLFHTHFKIIRFWLCWKFVLSASNKISLKFGNKEMDFPALFLAKS